MPAVGALDRAHVKHPLDIGAERATLDCSEDPPASGHASALFEELMMTNPVGIAATANELFVLSANGTLWSFHLTDRTWKKEADMPEHDETKRKKDRYQT
jgi:hypothetical protein